MQKDRRTMNDPQAALYDVVQTALLALHAFALSACLQLFESNDANYVSVI